MSAKQQLAEAIGALPESLTLEEAVERLYKAFKLKQASVRSSVRAAPNMTSSPERVRQLLDEERVPEARELALQSGETGWASVLAPPRVTLGERASGSGIDEEGIAPETLAPYPGQWVALRKGLVIAAALRRGDLRRQLAAAGDLEGCLFLKVDD